MSNPPKNSFVLDQPIESSSLVDSVVERLERAIISGELQGGTRISEQALAVSLGVSRSPLREALRRLEGRRLIERIPNVGARVVKLHPENLEEILAIREVLETLACRLAATAMSDAEIKDLERMLEGRRQRNIAKGPVLYDKSGDYDFHTRIIMACGNKTLVDIMLRDVYYLMKAYRYRTARSPERAQHAPLEHLKIVAALAARDPDEAERLMREHLKKAHAKIRLEITGAQGS
jgi:DNA-binding GntR family transcriptional regulator